VKAHVNVMDHWRSEDDTEEDRRQGIHNIDPALRRAMTALKKAGGGTAQIPPGQYRGFEGKLSS
jgi:polygalacturonase